MRRQLKYEPDFLYQNILTKSFQKVINIFFYIFFLNLYTLSTSLGWLHYALVKKAYGCLSNHLCTVVYLHRQL
jgi:hypothetical protein